MRLQLVDPSAFTPPYDRSLAAALARAGVEVQLVTSRFVYAPVPAAEGYTVDERFYRRATRPGRGDRSRRFAKLASHLPDMVRYANSRGRRAADLVHWQWVTFPGLDRWLVAPPRRPPRGGEPSGRGIRQPRVMTVHYPLPARRRALARQRRLLGAMDAVIAHSEHGAARIRDELGIDPGRVHVIPHGAFEHLTRVPDEAPLPDEMAGVEGPVVLFFGLLRPYKGIDVLLEAFREIDDAELWIAGMPRMPLDSLREGARRTPGMVRIVPRFVPDREIAAYFRRADLVVLPYREIEQSGVLYTALAFGKPIVLSEVGGFAELAAEGAARAVPPGDPVALRAAIRELLADDAERERLAAGARAEAAGPHSWDEAARRTLALYRELLAERA